MDVIQLSAERPSGLGLRTGATVAVFILCWSPYFVFGLLQVYGHVPNTQNNIAVATFIQSLAPLNSAANPVIYCLFSTRMCRTLRYGKVFVGVRFITVVR